MDAQCTQSVLQYWKSLNLRKLQRELDETAAELAARQDASEEGRKRLVEHSREAKKHIPEEARNNITPLLKNFQVEIDSLSRRAKAAEAVFLNLYKKIVESPDPVNALESVVLSAQKANRVDDLEQECRRLNEQLDKRDVVLGKQKDVVIGELRERLKQYEEGVEASVREKVQERETALRTTYEERERHLQEAGGILSQKLQESEKRSLNLQNALIAAQNEADSLREQLRDSAAGHTREVQILLTELDGLKRFKSVAEQQVYHLSSELKMLKNRKTTPNTVSLNDKPEHSAENDNEASTTKDDQVLPVGGAICRSIKQEKITPEDCGSSGGAYANSSSSRGSASGTPGPFQQVVETVGCILGAELVTAYNTRVVQEADPAGTDESTKEVKDISESPMENKEDEYKGDLDRLLKKHSLFDLEQAAKEGMPRYLAEAMAVEQLQGFINASVLTLGESALNTTQVANHCRQLLSMYNLGQRLFAKNILSQSQGSLSELLSKPRPWHRLTEKGREAFRKMYAWVSDERAIVLLRSLSPRRPFVSPAPKVNPEEFIASAEPVLSDSAISLLEETASPNSVTSTKKAASVSPGGEPGKAALSLALESRQCRRSSISPGGHKPVQPQVSNRWRHDDIPKEMIFQIYNRELSKLKKQEATLHQELRGRSQRPTNRRTSCGRPLDLAPSSVKRHDNADESKGEEQPQSSTPIPEDVASAVNAIFNCAAGSQSQTRGIHLKAILPPITQDQFERFPNVNTDDLVKEVKDFLTQQSISQRLFGEYVLGLSQGSVSDLLARPKPWYMLTQKGREPFIRMQMFLDDKAAVEALRQKKLNSALLGLGSTPPLATENCSDLDWTQLQLKQEPDFTTPDENSTNVQQSPEPSSNLTPGPRSRKRVEDSDKSKQASEELDTQSIVDEVKENLHSHGIGQKLFGEAVLCVSQGTVSELLSKAKPWPLLSLRGREPYIRMHWWLQDPQRVEKLQEYQRAIKNNGSNDSESGKSKRPYDAMNQEWSMNVKSEEGSNSSTSFALYGPPANKKTRSLITEQQKEALRFAFDHEPYPSAKTIELLAQELSLSVRTVVNWFHNHRMRVKLHAPSNNSSKQNGAVDDGDDLSSSTGTKSPQSGAAAKPDGSSYLGSVLMADESAGSSGSWRQELMHLISMLSSTEETVEDGDITADLLESENLNGLASADNGENPNTVEEAPKSDVPPVNKERQALFEKLEKKIKNEDLDWNAGLREEALSKLENRLNGRSELNDNDWEF